MEYDKETGEIVDEATDGKAFITMLQAINRGMLLHDIDDAMRELVCAIQEQGKKGTLTLTIDMQPDKQAPDVMRITPKVKIKKPEPPAGVALFWPSADGRLERHDPKQRQLFNQAS